MARIKKIMKLDEDVKMISQEAPLLFAKAAEIFISELALRSWVQTEDSKRRTLQVNYIVSEHLDSGKAETNKTNWGTDTVSNIMFYVGNVVVEHFLKL